MTVMGTVRAVAAVGSCLMAGLGVAMLINELPFIGSVLFFAPVLWWVGGLIVAFCQDLWEAHKLKAEERGQTP